MKTFRATDVFTPAEFPRLTYVERPDTKLEQHLRDALSTPGEIISISGPSKSGKTVVVERVVGDELITVTGAGIETPSDLWDRVLDWMGSPAKSITSTRDASSIGSSVSVEGGASLLGLVKGKAGATGNLESGSETSETEERARRGLSQVISEIGDSGYVILVDDYHYMERSAQSSVAKEIKEAARQRVKVVTASVPHRSDDVVRSNPELRGRVRAIDTDYWSKEDLRIIADTGFPLLSIDMDERAIAKFSSEASGSPQLMQAICLQACFDLDIRETLSKRKKVTLSDGQIQRTLQETASRSDFSSLVRAMHSGPKKRGTERKEFGFADRTRGDVYRCILLALATDPPALGFDYNNLYMRIQRMCLAETPIASSIYQACSQVSNIARALYPDQRVIEWDDDGSRLDIIDPYFLFFLRWSDRLVSLAESS